MKARQIDKTEIIPRDQDGDPELFQNLFLVRQEACIAQTQSFVLTMYYAVEDMLTPHQLDV